ncbi:MAG: hypothetical protein COV76_00605 [Candidatus Omnitrophica bacterium CG11_big_fil_rev_8_21_14_0_20_64_10]|nr:MAG: hypothetical protein COV76_00605 [Candidatus Omnitrophica bacterium CG11_big_fil_rev_8_21_14_0_20_64_10]
MLCGFDLFGFLGAEVSNVVLLYFFSALAQSAAALIAVIGVFAVFRLQNNGMELSDSYRMARAWMKHLNFSAADSFSKDRVKELLRGVETNNGKLAEEIEGWHSPREPKENFRSRSRELLELIGICERRHNNLVVRAVPSFVAWSSVFLGSLIALVVIRGESGSSSIFLPGVFLILTLWSGFRTRAFMRICLSDSWGRENKA